jgi:hypothetical protein
MLSRLSEKCASIGASFLSPALEPGNNYSLGDKVIAHFLLKYLYPNGENVLCGFHAPGRRGRKRRTTGLSVDKEKARVPLGTRASIKKT